MMRMLGLRAVSAAEVLSAANRMHADRRRAARGGVFIMRAAKTKGRRAGLHEMQFEVARCIGDCQPRPRKFAALLSLLLGGQVLADDPLPPLMNTRGKLLVDEPMDKQPP